MEGGELEGNMRERRRRGKEILEVDEPHPTRRHKCHSGVWNRTGKENMGQEKGPRNTIALPKKYIKIPLHPQHSQLGAKAKLNSY